MKRMDKFSILYKKTSKLIDRIGLDAFLEYIENHKEYKNDKSYETIFKTVFLVFNTNIESLRNFGIKKTSIVYARKTLCYFLNKQNLSTSEISRLTYFPSDLIRRQIKNTIEIVDSTDSIVLKANKQLILKINEIETKLKYSNHG